MAEAAAKAALEAVTLKDDADFAGRVAEHQPYYQKRIQLFEEYRARHVKAFEEAKAAAVPISVLLPDGSCKLHSSAATSLLHTCIAAAFQALHMPPPLPLCTSQP
jgi:hypothetical protein